MFKKDFFIGETYFNSILFLGFIAMVSELAGIHVSKGMLFLFASQAPVGHLHCESIHHATVTH